MNPKLAKVVGGWFAIGDGWAVFGLTENEAVQKFHEAEERHTEIMSRPEPSNSKADKETVKA